MRRTCLPRRPDVAVVLAAVAVMGLAGCGTSSVVPDSVAVGDRVVPAGGAPFAAPRLTWAQGRTLHYGSRTFPDVVDRKIIGLLRVPAGFFLRVVADDQPVHEYDDVVFWNGRTLTEVSSAVATSGASQDGRYVGWLERDPAGARAGLAAIRVVDLGTGRLVVSTTDGMGDPDAGAEDLAELYANANPSFDGFDALDRAYWHRAQARVPNVRHDPATGRETRGVIAEEGFPRNMLWDANRGYRALGPPAAGLSAPWPRLDGLVTADEQVFVDDANGVVHVYRASAPRQVVRLPTGHRFAWFHGWADEGDHRIALLVRDRNEGGYDPAVPDSTTGWILTCEIDRATCGTAVPVSGTRSVVFDDGLDPRPY